MSVDIALPLARQWFDAPFPKRHLAEQVLKLHAQGEDGERAQIALARSLEDHDIYRTCACLDIVTTANWWTAADLVCVVYDEVPYSYARSRATRFLAELKSAAVGDRLIESLWDCEDESVLTGLTAGIELESATKRIATLATSPFHDDDVRSEASRWTEERPVHN